MTIVRVGTRGSRLALAQSGQVVAALRAHRPSIEFETVVIKTTGDVRATVPFSEVGTKGMFVKEIEEALLAGSIDFAVHSLKDMPSELPDGLALAATPKREDARDALISNEGTLKQLPAGAVVGTSSPRRQAQLRAARSDVTLRELRGNLDTRLRKLDDGDYDAIVLACAGLERLGMADRITERIPIDISVPAPGQGILALEVRAEDAAVRTLLSTIDDRETALAAATERAFQGALSAGCSVPAGAYAQVDGGQITLVAVIARPDGSQVFRTELTGAASEARFIGEHAAAVLLSMSRGE